MSGTSGSVRTSLVVLLVSTAGMKMNHIAAAQHFFLHFNDDLPFKN
ncbi:hypothetical protein PSE_1274 [Pseudovibrio sp. FO-BEG1]|nr:hypothetical protein PSE_1274 [Pseudovibrio sp. FO-BEG1]